MCKGNNGLDVDSSMDQLDGLNGLDGDDRLASEELDMDNSLDG